MTEEDKKSPSIQAFLFEMFCNEQYLKVRLEVNRVDWRFINSVIKGLYLLAVLDVLSMAFYPYVKPWWGIAVLVVIAIGARPLWLYRSWLNDQYLIMLAEYWGMQLFKARVKIKEDS